MKLSIFLPALVALVMTLLAATVQADALFESEETVKITLEAPLAAMRKARDKEIKYPATLKHENSSYDLEVSVRGNKRLQRMTCKNPPLWLDFDKDQVKGTLFHHQKHTKLVVLCRKGKVNFDYLRAEFLVYKMHEMVLPVSFRVRWAEVTYVEEKGTRTEPAFFIERKQRLAKRVDMDNVDLQRVEYKQLEPDTAALASLFNYVVANPDFSLISAMSGSCCHNAKLMQNDDGEYVPVLYDFDSCGILAARYAAPNPSLKIKKVTDRIYRGYCMHNKNLEKARSTLLGAEADFRALLANDPILSKNYKKKMTRFLNRSLRLIERDADWNSKVINKCRGERA